MDSIFSYESKFVQMLLKLADMMIMNVLYVLCCLPVFTAGAAQAALHTGIRQLRNQEDDTSCVKAFFRGFASGFGKITLVHTLGLLLIGVLVWFTAIVVMIAGYTLPTWICVAGICLAILFLSQIPLFHSNFDCKASQMPKNAFLIVMAHPLRSLGVAALIWAPAAVLALDLFIFMRGFPIWLLLYYSTAFLFCNSLTKKPIEGMKEDFLAAQKAASGEDADNAVSS